MNKLERNAAARIIARLDQAARDPHASFCKLTGFEDYKLRAGDYRIIALLLHETKTIFAERVGHRKNVYKQLAR